MKLFFLPCADGRQLCCTYFPPAGCARGAVLMLPPWGEEMHKSRHVLSRTARALAASGFGTLLFDLYGTGDSGGDFGDASWALWQQDCHAARAWLAQECCAPQWLWGMRTGCLLIPPLLADAAADGVLLWQPVSAGKSFLTQTLRLKLASGLEAGGEGGLNTAPLLAALRAGEAQEIGGYLHAPDLLLPLESATLELPAGQTARVVWLEVGSREPAVLLPASQRVVDRWKERGLAVHAEAFTGPAFWQTVELDECPALEARTVALLEAAS